MCEARVNLCPKESRQAPTIFYAKQEEGSSMPQKLKDLFFSGSFINQLADTVQEIYLPFDKGKFTDLIYDGVWETRELKEKMRHVSGCLHQTLPEDYAQALEILKQVAPSFRSFDAMVFPDYVERYGLDDWDLSLPALGFFTQFASSEFAVRPFLARDPERAMAYLQVWAEDENHHLRRLASEGCRPRLPWGMALTGFKKDPSLILPILEKLKNDESEYVRKSVANNLNDISKDHPNLVLDICEEWHGHTKNTDWIVKHACRGMLKAGNKRALSLFGFGDPTQIRVENLRLDKETLRIGEDLHYTFELNVATQEPCKLRLELGIYYVKARGNLSRKVFKIGEKSFDPGRHSINRKVSFADRSTRKHYAGQHQISIFVNGVEMATASLDLAHV
jgi:3-methyladenine DNA glycosylase AlkC